MLGTWLSAEAFTAVLAGPYSSSLVLPGLPTAFAKYLQLKERLDELLICDGASWEIRVLTNSGETRRIVRSLREEREATEADLEQFVDGRRDALTAKQALLAPRTLPSISAIEVDNTGRIWAKDHRISDAIQRWVLFNPDGTEVGSLALSAALNVLAFREAEVVVLGSEAGGAESVHWYAYTLPQELRPVRLRWPHAAFGAPTPFQRRPAARRRQATVANFAALRVDHPGCHRRRLI
jgi:hypothetical protein